MKQAEHGRKCVLYTMVFVVLLNALGNAAAPDGARRSARIGLLVGSSRDQMLSLTTTNESAVTQILTVCVS